MPKITIELQNQLEENIKAHQDILKMSKEIVEIIYNIEKKNILYVKSTGY